MGAAVQAPAMAPLFMFGPLSGGGGGPRQPRVFLLRRWGQAAQQAALLAEAVGMLSGFLHARPGLYIGTVEVLARVGDRMPVDHADRRTAGVVELPLRVPQRPVVEVGRRFDVVAGFLIAARRLVAETALQVAVGGGGGFPRIWLCLFA